MSLKIDEILKTVSPGQTVYFDFEVVGTQALPAAELASQIKRQVWGHPKLDYQSSKLSEGLFNTETQREVSILRVWASVRSTDKATWLAVTEMPLAEIDAWVGAAVAVWREQVQDWWTFVENYPSVSEMAGAVFGAGEKTASELKSMVPLVILAVLAYFLLKG